MLKERTALTLTIALPLITLIGYFKAEQLASMQAEELAEARFWILKTHRIDTFDIISLGDSKEYYDDGWLASQLLKDDPNSALVTYQNIFINNQVSEELVMALLTQTQQSTQEGILVFGFRFPSTEQIETTEAEQSGFDEAAFVNAGGILIDVPADAYRSYEGSHLHKEGALEYSVDLAEITLPYLEIPTHYPHFQKIGY